MLAPGFELPELPHGFAALNLSPNFLSDTPAPPMCVFEVVGTGLEELAGTRERFKAYHGHGFEIRHFDMSGKA